MNKEGSSHEYEGERRRKLFQQYDDLLHRGKGSVSGTANSIDLLSIEKRSDGGIEVGGVLHHSDSEILGLTIETPVDGRIYSDGRIEGLSESHLRNILASFVKNEDNPANYPKFKRRLPS